MRCRTGSGRLSARRSDLFDVDDETRASIYHGIKNKKSRQILMSEAREAALEGSLHFEYPCDIEIYMNEAEMIADWKADGRTDDEVQEGLDYIHDLEKMAKLVENMTKKMIKSLSLHTT